MGIDETDLLDETFSAARLTPYRHASGDDPRRVSHLYAWNIDISEAFHWSLCCLEVALRNALHWQVELAGLLGRADWWNASAAQLHHVALCKINDAQTTLVARGKTPTPDRVLAELTLGFWVSLLGSGTDYETRLWRPALRHAFPGYSGSRKSLHRELDQVRRLRNRIAHHEPIHQRHLAADHDTVLRLISYIRVDLAAWIRMYDRVPEVLARRDGTRAAARLAAIKITGNPRSGEALRDQQDG